MHSTTTVAAPAASSRRADEVTCRSVHLVRDRDLTREDALQDVSRQPPRQWEHNPVISITDILGAKPAPLAAAAIVSPTARAGASPTAPHRSQIRKATAAPKA